MKFLFCTLVIVFTFFSNSILCFSHQNGGSDESWFEDIDFEEYKPAAGYHRSNHGLKVLQVPCGIILNNSVDDQKQQPSRVYPLPTRLDTSLVQSRISQKALQKKANPNLSNLAVKKGRRHIIPEGSLLLRLERTTVPSPEIEIIEDNSKEDHDDDDSFDLFLGMDFLSTYQAIINIREGELHIIVDKEEVMIPLIQRRDNLLKEDL